MERITTDRLSPLPAAVTGTMLIAFSGIWVGLADVQPAAAGFFRCAYAVPLLWLFARREGRGSVTVGRTSRQRLLAMGAGLFFTVDLIAWHGAIAAVGAGLGTVLASGQVVVVALAARVFLGERVARPVITALPVMLAGVVLISGAVGAQAYGGRPVLGVVLGVVTSLAYAGFLLLLRASNPEGARPVASLFDATWVGATGTACVALLSGDAISLLPSWPSAGWLLGLAVGSQVVAWVLITSALPRLAAVTSSLVLTLQPAGSLLLGMIILGERPAPLQLVGAAVVLVAVVYATGELPGTGLRRAPTLPPAGRARRDALTRAAQRRAGALTRSTGGSRSRRPPPARTP